MSAPGTRAGEAVQASTAEFPAATTVVDPARHASKGRNSPYRGMELPGAVRATFFRGHPTVLDGALNTPAPTPAA